MNNIALIPARAGSKGVPNKNLRTLAEKPLISYSIESSLSCTSISRTIVTTDSTAIAEVSLAAGAEVPFLRPKEYAEDNSSDRSYIIHALDWLRDNEGVEPDCIVLLRPTTPIRDAKLLQKAIDNFRDVYHQATSLRSVHALAEPPQKMLQFDNGWLTGFFPEDKRPEYYNLPRQCFPTAYHPNGYIDIIKPSFVRQNPDSLFGTNILGFETPHSVEIDAPEDFAYLEYLMSVENV